MTRLSDEQITQIGIFISDEPKNVDWNHVTFAAMIRNLLADRETLQAEIATLKAELAEAKPYKDQHDRAARQMRMGL